MAACAASGGGERPATVRVAGSDTMLVLVRRWAEEYMRHRPGVVVTVEGGGTQAGIEALVAGRAEIAAASRPLRPDEVERLYGRYRTLGVEFLCARDGLSVYLHPDNPVRDLTRLQLKGLFIGRIGSWAKVGGRDEPVRVVTRQPSSGTHRLFLERVLDEEPYSQRAKMVPTTEAVLEAVRADPTAVGYGGLAHGADLVHCRVEGVAPSPRTVADGTYPLTRYLYLVTRRPPEGATKSFIDWALSPRGQTVVREVGFIPLWVQPVSR